MVYFFFLYDKCSKSFNLFVRSNKIFDAANSPWMLVIENSMIIMKKKDRVRDGNVCEVNLRKMRFSERLNWVDEMF